jgi:hypothetical protein
MCYKYSYVYEYLYLFLNQRIQTTHFHFPSFKKKAEERRSHCRGASGCGSRSAPRVDWPSCTRQRSTSSTGTSRPRTSYSARYARGSFSHLSGRSKRHTPSTNFLLCSISTQSSPTCVMGTYGYAAPGYVATGTSRMRATPVRARRVPERVP